MSQARVGRYADPSEALVHGTGKREVAVRPKAQDVADYFLVLGSDEYADESVSNLKLQKLCYYAQGFCLAVHGRPLFDEEIVAWQHGPVIRELWNAYRANGARGIEKPESWDFSLFSPGDREVMDDVYEAFGQFSAWKLRDMSHEEPPWKETPVNGVITHDRMKNYFRTRIY